MSGDPHPRKKEQVPNEFFPSWAGPEYWLFVAEAKAEEARKRVEELLRKLNA